jgi:hypothetical protein
VGRQDALLGPRPQKLELATPGSFVGPWRRSCDGPEVIVVIAGKFRGAIPRVPPRPAAAHAHAGATPII